MTLAGISDDATVTVRVGSTEYEIPWVGTYGEVDAGDLLLHVDGSGLMALAVRGGSAADVLRLVDGQSVTFKS
jgi:S-adenosylmethionine hydrolase